MKKIAIIYGTLENGVQKKAVALLSELLLDYTLEYPFCYPYGTPADLSAYRCIYIGTKENHPYIKKTSTATLTHEEEYAITVKNDTVTVEGYDDRGVLYGCMDFYNKYVVPCEYPNIVNIYWQNCFEKPLPDFSYSSYPSVRNRGIWTWGHVIYDYRSFIDHMVKLKMNTLTVWNDHIPVNAEEMVAYAHSCGVKIIWGFPWLWDTDCRKVDLLHLKDHSEEILAFYEAEYGRVPADGIYFQTATELYADNIGGVSIADAVVDFVNHTSNLFLERYPSLEIQFGLHATSVKKRLDAIARVDPRVRIVWENCGSFPFAYVPNDVAHFGETMDFVKQIATLRGENERFGAVTKGLTKLDWSKFEHMEASLYIGESSRAMQENRITRKHRIWRYLQAYWLVHADKVLETVKTMRDATDGDLYVTPLVEDGMFERNIMFPVALLSEMLWDADAPIDRLMSEVALRSYVDFA